MSQSIFFRQTQEIMKNLPLFILFFMSLFLFYCEKENDVSTEEGYESYRYELWKNLLDEGYQFDFIGALRDEGNYPDHAQQAFDRDHQGTGGIQTNGILQQLNDDLDIAQSADVVLLGIGGNDLLNNPESYLPTILMNINEIIDILQAQNPNVIIFIEQIAPGHSDLMTNDLNDFFNSFNSQIPTIAANQTNDNSTVIPVNMSTAWQDDYLADPVHYNEEGAKIVADRYFQAMKNTLPINGAYSILPLGDSRVEGFRP